MGDDVIIRVEGLGKKYRLGQHQEQGRYTALRDVLADKAKASWQFLRRSGRAVAEADAEDFWALREVNFEVGRGEVVGIIGRNGAGKSTLLKVLSRITEPTSGKITLHGRVASLLEVGTGFHPELTGRENIYLNGAVLGMHRAEIRAKFDEIVAFAEVEKFLDTPVKRYSSGMYVRLAFAVAAHLEPEILVVDEVLAVGDAEFQKKCLGKMREVAAGQGRTVLFVSHNMAAVSQLCRRGVALGQGRIVFQGSAADAVSFYHRHLLGKNDRDTQTPHVLYTAGQEEIERESHLITKIELLDPEKNPKAVLQTWDDVIFRIHFHSRTYRKSGSVVLEIAALDGTKLGILSTRPGGSLEIELREGTQAVDCRFPRFPLAGGEYIVGAGLADPKVEWIYRRPELAALVVEPKDVMNCGFAPTSEFGYVVPQHAWEIVRLR